MNFVNVFKDNNMKPLVVLFASFLIATFLIKVTYKEYDFALSSRVAMSIMLWFTAIGHFAFTKGMSMMIPQFIPFKKNFCILNRTF